MKDSLKALMLLNACEKFNGPFWDFFQEKGLEPRQLWEEADNTGRLLNMSEGSLKRIRELVSRGWAEREYEKCHNSGIRILSLEDPHYPEILSRSPHSPLVIYLQGCILPFNDTVSIVGTRKCTRYGRSVSYHLAGTIASAGGTVVSGGARGIDMHAHEGALSSKGKTVAVLGTGVDIVYPVSNERLFSRIKEEGALLSEYPLGTPGERWRFPRRNRIIAGLSDITVVVEAPRKSGAMITANYAAEAGRDVWAVPGRIDEEVSRGTNSLISDGASPLVDIKAFTAHVFSGQLEIFSQKEDNTHFKEEKDLSEGEKAVLGILRQSGDRTVDNISSECKMSAADVLTCLGNLLAKGMVYPAGPGRWRAGS
jgi:DNA processing protein